MTNLHRHRLVLAWTRLLSCGIAALALAASGAGAAEPASQKAPVREDVERLGRDLRPDFALRGTDRLGPFEIQRWIPREDPDFFHAPVWASVLVVKRDGIEVLRRLATDTDEALKPSEDFGRDLTGDGSPELVIQGWTGGAHCCHWTEVYSLVPSVRRLLDSPKVDCEGEFRDLDGDGRQEFLTCDSAFAYKFCSFADSPLPRVVYGLDAKRGYVPLTPRFAAHLEPIAQVELEPRREEFPTADYPTETAIAEERRCRVLSVALEMMYRGDESGGIRFIEQNYRQPDQASFLGEVRAILDRSSMYVR